MPDRESYASRLFWSAVIPALVGIGVLFIEYWTGWFQQSAVASATRGKLICSITITLFVTVLVLFFSQYLLIWLRPYRYTREAFALAALCVGVATTLLLIMCLICRLMPWSAISLTIAAMKQRNADWPILKWSDYAVLILLYMLSMWWVRQSFRNWPGKKSVAQYEREQQNENSSLIKEALLELKRIIHRKPPFPEYTEPAAKDFITQLEPVTDSLAWRDQARELVKLSSSSYSFDADTDWHENQRCWIGLNVNTNELVALFPRRESMVEKDLRQGIAYAKRIAQNKNVTLGEVIVATPEKTNGPAKLDGFVIRNLHESQLLDGLVDFKDYFNEIRKRVITYRASDSVLTLSEVYVPSRFSLKENRIENKTVEQYLNKWLADPRPRQLALLGEYGQGKSTAATMWAYHQIESGLVNGRVPLLIELRGTSPRNLTTLGLLGAWASKYNINPQALMKLLVAGRLTIIFEGFDEMSLVGDATMRLNHFRTLWQFAYPKAKILITGRPNFFLDEEEMKAALGISKPLGGRPYSEAVRLAPFDAEQIKQALRAYDSQVREQIYNLALKNERFRDIVSRPSLLQIVAGLWQQEKLSQKIDELTSAFVMDLFVRQSYRREGLKDKDFPGIMALTTAEREYFMLGIASYMASKELPNQISGRQLNQTIKQLLTAIPDSVSVNTPMITGEVNRPLKDRTENNDLALEHLMTDVRACGLLVDDPSSPGTFRFGHKSFMEFLFAAVLADLIQNPTSERARAIAGSVGADMESIIKLPVAMDFLSELLVVNLSKEVGRNPALIARRLLRTITGEGVRGLFRRTKVFWELYSFLSLLRLSSRHKRLGAMTRFMFSSGPFLIVIGSWLLIFLSVLLNKAEPSEFRSAIAFTLIFIGMLLSVFRSEHGGPLQKRVLLWLRLCYGMNIQATDVHKASRTWLVPKINRMSPYSYLKKHWEGPLT